MSAGGWAGPGRGLSGVGRRGGGGVGDPAPLEPRGNRTVLGKGWRQCVEGGRGVVVPMCLGAGLEPPEMWMAIHASFSLQPPPSAPSLEACRNAVSSYLPLLPRQRPLLPLKPREEWSRPLQFRRPELFSPAARCFLTPRFSPG